MTFASRCLTILSFALLVTAVGCGSGDSLELAGVSGKVTLNGEPVEDGRITFTPKQGISSGAASGPIKNGEYDIPEDEGPVVGEHTVSINASRSTGKKIPAAMPAPPGTMIEVTEEYIPSKYNYESELTAELKSGDNVKDFDLKGGSKDR